MDFLNRIVIVSTQNAGSEDIFGVETEVSAVLDFDSKAVVIISDDESNLPLPCPGFYPLYDIVSVPREDLPVDFIRVKNLKAVNGLST